MYEGITTYSAHCTNISVHNIYFREYFLERTAIVDDVTRWLRVLGTFEVYMEGTVSSDHLEFCADEARFLAEAVQLHPKPLAWLRELCREQILAGVHAPMILAAPNSDV